MARGNGRAKQKRRAGVMIRPEDFWKRMHGRQRSKRMAGKTNLQVENYTVWDLYARVYHVRGQDNTKLPLGYEVRSVIGPASDPVYVPRLDERGPGKASLDYDHKTGPFSLNQYMHMYWSFDKSQLGEPAPFGGDVGSLNTNTDRIRWSQKENRFKIERVATVTPRAKKEESTPPPVSVSSQDIKSAAVTPTPPANVPEKAARLLGIKTEAPSSSAKTDVPASKQAGKRSKLFWRNGGANGCEERARTEYFECAADATRPAHRRQCLEKYKRSGCADENLVEEEEEDIEADEDVRRFGGRHQVWW